MGETHRNAGANPNDERRDARRRYATLPVRAKLLIPEISPEPLVWSGVARNISARGMMLEILGMDQDTCRHLIAAQRQVILSLPGDGRPDDNEIHGKVVWVDYRPHCQPRPLCNLGLCFEHLDRPQAIRLEQILHDLLDRPDTTY
ncbi:MAG: hypothetical protein Kow0059_16240 [Candidatus Sumerlaeia bacterium]